MGFRDYFATQQLKARLREGIDGQVIPAILGDGNGIVASNTVEGYVRARQITSVEDGSPQYGMYFNVLAGANAPTLTSGKPVFIQYGKATDALEIAELNAHSIISLGGNPIVESKKETPQLKWVSKDMLIDFRGYPVSKTTNSLKSAVNGGVHINRNNELKWYGQAKQDISGFVPAGAGTKNLLLVYLDNDPNNANRVIQGFVQGTAKATGLSFDEDADVNELIAGMPASAMPIMIYTLTNGQTRLDDSHIYRDMRQIINAPTGRNIKTTAPTVNDDIDGGFLPLDVWIDTSDNTIYLCRDNANGAADWQAFIPSGGSGTESSNIRTITTSTTAAADDATVLIDSSSGAVTYTLPDATTVTGRKYSVKRISTGSLVTIATTASQTIDGSATVLITSQYSAFTVQSDGSNWHKF